MTKIEFKQKRGLSERHYILYDDKISVNIKSISRLVNYEVRLDKLGFEKNYQADNPLIGKIFFLGLSYHSNCAYYRSNIWGKN